MPKSKVTKTQDGNVILIELENSGWKFSANDHLIDVESGLYFGNKNSYTQNQNIFISGITEVDTTWFGFDAPTKFNAWEVLNPIGIEIDFVAEKSSG